MIKRISKLGFISMICVGVLCFILVISLSAKMSAKSKAVIARKDIGMGTLINEENIDELFEIGEIKDGSEEDYFTYLSDLNGSIVICDMTEGQTLTSNQLIDTYKPISDIEEPVVMGLRASDASQFVSGTLRRGDTVNLSFVDEHTGECNRVLEDVFVCGAYNDDGSMVQDDSGRAMSINIVVEKNDEKQINEYLHKGQLRISKTGSGLND